MTSLQKASLDEIREISARLCRDYLTGRWKVVPAEQLVVKRISGGLSNFLYYVSLPDENESPLASASSAGGAIKNRILHEQQLDDGTGDNNANKRQRTDSDGSSSVTSTQQQQQQEEEPKEVLLRVYGQAHGEDALEAMITESVVFALLSERNFGPKLHGIFPGGRIEQYIPARALITTELSDAKISMKIAEKMGEIHSLNIPMSKEPVWLWNCMDRWLKNIANTLSKTDWKFDEDEVKMVREFNFNEEIKWLKSVINEGNYTVLFCHNDMQEGNILYCEADTRESVSSLRSNFEETTMVNTETEDVEALKRKRALENNGNNPVLPTDFESTRDATLSYNSEDCDPDLRIIDFEYCAYNYRGFDLANHFLEWTFDYSNSEFPFYFHHKHQYPTKQQRRDFIVSYLKKLNENVEGYLPSAEELEGVEKEVRLFSMFSHLFWSLWSIVNLTSNIEFGYWNYAVTRIKEYKMLKQAFDTEQLEVKTTAV